MQRIGAHLREHRLVALSGACRADEHIEDPVSIEANARLLLRSARTALDEGCKPDAMAATVDHASLQGLLLDPPDLLQRLLEHRAEIAGIELRRRLVVHQLADVEGHLLRGDEIAPPDVGRIDAEIARRHVDQSFAKEIGLDASRAAVGSRWRLVGDVSIDRAGEVRNTVRPRQKLGTPRRRRAAGAARIGADVDRDLAAQPQDDAVAVAGDLEIAGRLARVVGGQEMLAPILHPFDRAVELPRDERDQKVFRVELAAHAEAAAGVGHLHDHRAFGQARACRQRRAVEERHLGDAGHGHAGAGFVPDRDEPACLHRDGGVALHAEGLAPDVRRRPERRLGVAAADADAGMIGAGILVDERGRLAAPSQLSTGGSSSISAEISETASSAT